MHLKYKNQSAFTLIELLVVIAIIGLLASVIMVSLTNARSRARDAKRVADMKNLQQAIEMYVSDFGSYPLCTGSNTLCVSTGAPYSALNTLAVVPNYVATIPNDPLNQTAAYGYYYARGYKRTGSNLYANTGLATDYIIATRLENPTNNPNAVSTFVGWDNNNLNYLAGGSY